LLGRGATISKTREARSASEIRSPDITDGGKTYEDLETFVLQGANVIVLFPIVRHKVDIGVLETGRRRL